MTKQNKKDKSQQLSQDGIVLDFENPPPIPEVDSSNKKSKKSDTKSTPKEKEETVNYIKDEPKQETESSSIKRKRNPPNFKLKIAIIEHLKEKNIDSTIIQQIRQLFGLAAIV